MEIPIVFEDESVLVINKPAGLTVNRAETTKGQETVQEWAERKFSIFPPSPELRRAGNLQFSSETEKEFVDRGGVVHRLDKETSGLLIIAKTSEAFENLKSQFQNREVVKKYLALVHGKVEPEVGVINAPIGRSPFNRTHFGIFPGGREAETKYKVVNVYQLKSNPAGHFSLLEITPKTGRTHQIRVHLKYINHPIVSDPLYAGRKQLREDLNFCPRLFLHAFYLKFKHPKTGKELEFKLDLPEDLAGVLGKFDAG